MDLINKAETLLFFSTAAILQNWITNKGMNFLDTAYLFQSNVWMHMSGTFSNFLTLLGVGGASACFMGLEMLYKAVGWDFYQSFHLRRCLEHQSFVVLGCHHSSLLETFVSYLKSCRFSLLCTPPGCWTGTRRVLLTPAKKKFLRTWTQILYTRADSYPGNLEISKQRDTCSVASIKDMSLLLTQFQDTSN